MYQPPSTFQRTMDKVISKYMNNSPMPYQGDMIILSKSEGEYFEHIQWYLKLYKSITSYLTRKNVILWEVKFKPSTFSVWK